MPTPDPGYQAYLKNAAYPGSEFDIVPTEFGWKWITPERVVHELHATFLTVHVTRPGDNIVLGDN